MQVNGEAIWGTTASPFKRSLPWGRCTKKLEGDAGTFYLHVFDWPKDGELILPGLKNHALAAFLLADSRKQALATETTENGLLITIPKTRPTLLASDTTAGAMSATVVVRIAGSPDVQPMVILQRRDGSVTLPASEARLHGSTFQYESGGLLDNIGYWTTPEDWVDWEFKIKEPGKFTVSAEIAAPVSGSFEISAGGQALSCAAPKTANYVSFRTATLGVIDLPASGKVVLAVRPIKEGWQPMNLKAIRLEPLSASR